MEPTVRTGLLCVPTLDDAALAAVGKLLRARLPGCVVLLERSVGGQRYALEDLLVRWCDEEELDLVLTLGGSWLAPGPGGQEMAPEATLAVVERLLPGLPEAMRAYAQEETPLALLDRGVAGIRGRTLLINLPAGPASAVLFLEAVAEVLPAILAHLREDAVLPRMEDHLLLQDVLDEASSFQDSTFSGLDAAQFAAYLRHRGKGSAASA